MNTSTFNASRWSTKEILVSAVIGAALGLLFTAYSLLWTALSPLMGMVPVMVLYGFYFVAGILVPYIVRRPGAAILAETVAAIVEVLAGSPFGAQAIVAGFIQGAAAELAFALWRWHRYDLLSLSLAGLFAGLAAFAHDYVVFAYFTLEGAAQIGIVALMAISGILLGGVLSMVIGDALTRTGVLGGFAIGKVKTRIIG